VTDFFEDYKDYEELFFTRDDSEESLQDLSEEGALGSSKSRHGPRKSESRSGFQDDLQSFPEFQLGDPKAVLEGGLPLPDVLPALLGQQAELPELLDFEARSGPLDSSPILPVQLLVASTEPVPAKSKRGESRKTQARMDSQVDAPRPKVQRNAGRGRGRRASGNGDKPLIGDLVKEGQQILVQAAKEPIAKKGARITSHIVLPGRYLVFMPTVNHVGVSRRIESSKERQRLRDLIQELRGEMNWGFIVRTAGEAKKKAEFQRDMVYLTRLWEKIRAKSDKSKAPSLIHSELGLVQRVLRDRLSSDFKAIRVDDREVHEEVLDFVTNFNPALAKKVRMFNRKTPIFDAFNVNNEIEKALKSKVWLKSGGSIVINQTEALVAIDVNTGKYVGNTNSLEDTIAKTNLDAVKEVVRQIRLRDLGGIIVIDFIDMNDQANQKKVLEALRHELSNDKSPSKILPFNEFGLVAITRKRAKQSLERTFCQPCACCEGTGVTKSERTVCHSIYAEVTRSLSAMKKGKKLIVRCHPDIAKALRGSEKDVAREIEAITGKELIVKTDPLMHIEQFEFTEA
jgi:ribonuclease G